MEGMKRENFFGILSGSVKVMFVSFTFLFSIILFPLLFMPSAGEILSVGKARWVQMVTSFVTFVVPVVAFELCFSPNILESLSLSTRPQKKMLGFFALCMLLILPTISLLEEWNRMANSYILTIPQRDWILRLEERADASLSVLLTCHSLWDIVCIFFVVAVCAGFCEEVLFRGFLQNRLERILGGHHWAIWISAVLFSLIHFQFNGFIPRMIMGVFLGYSLVWGRSLWIPIVLHIINNSIAVTLKILFDKNILDSKWNSFFWEDHPVEVMLPLFLCIGLIYWKARRKRIPKMENR